MRESTYNKIKSVIEELRQSGTVNEVGIESGTDFQSGTVINVDNLINDVNQSGTVETGTMSNGTVENGTVKTGTVESVPDFQSGTVNDDEICVDMYTTPEERANATMAYLNDSSKRVVTRDIIEMNEIVDMLFSDF